MVSKTNKVFHKKGWSALALPLVLAACSGSGSSPTNNSGGVQQPPAASGDQPAVDGSAANTGAPQSDGPETAAVFSLTILNDPADEIYLVLQGDQSLVFDYTGDDFDRGQDCFAVSPLDSELQSQLSVAPGAAALGGVTLPVADVAVLNKAPVCEGTGSLISTGPQPVVGAGSTHAQVQQRFQTHPRLLSAQAAGDTYDFTESTASQLRNLLAGSMVTITVDVGTGININNQIRRSVFCPGGELIYAFSTEDTFVNLQAENVSDAFLTDENTELFRGYWDVAQFSGTQADGAPLNSLIIMNMFDVSEFVTNEGTVLDFPAPGQADVPLGDVLLTADSEALRIVVDEWALVAQFGPQGIQLPLAESLSPRTAAPPICGQ